MNDYIAKAKVLLNITDNLQDELLEVIQNMTLEHFRAHTGVIGIPNALEFIIIEMMIKRFNRIGAEGLTTQAVDGLSQTFSENDFSEYQSAIDAVLYRKSRQGVAFL